MKFYSNSMDLVWIYYIFVICPICLTNSAGDLQRITKDEGNQRKNGSESSPDQNGSQDPVNSLQNRSSHGSHPYSSLLLNPVDITICDIDGSRPAGSSVDFNVDHTVNMLLVIVESTNQDENPFYTVLNPMGLPVDVEGGNVTIIRNDSRSRDILISDVTPGKWTIQLVDRTEYSILVKANSVLNFRTRFVDDYGYTILFPPVAGATMNLVLEIYGEEEILHVTEVVFISVSGEVLSETKTAKALGRDQRTYAIESGIPNQDFRIGIIGNDKFMIPVQRVQALLIKPLVINYSVQLKETSPEMPRQGDEYVVEYLIANNNTHPEKFYLHVSLNTPDSSVFSYRLSQDIIPLPSKSVGRGNLTINVSQNATIGLICHINLTVDTTRNISKSATMLLTVQGSSTDTSSRSVETDTTTKTTDINISTPAPRWHDTTTVKPSSSGMIDVHPPAFFTTSFVDRCDKTFKCSKRKWMVTFKVQDDESGIHRISVEDETQSSIATEKYIDGLSKTPVHGNVSTNCCKSKVVVIVEDVEGNKGRFPVNYHRNNSADSNSTSQSINEREKVDLMEISGILVGSLVSILLIVIITTVAIEFHKKIHAFFRKTKKDNYTRRLVLKYEETPPIKERVAEVV